jgi:hypothetical protein
MKIPPRNISRISIDDINIRFFPDFTDAGSKANLIVCLPAGTLMPRNI